MFTVAGLADFATLQTSTEGGYHSRQGINWISDQCLPRYPQLQEYSPLFGANGLVDSHGPGNAFELVDSTLTHHL